MSKTKKTKKHRNSAGRRRKAFKGPPAGWLGSTVASLVGGGGGALLGGVLASQGIVKPKTAGMLMSVAGSIGGVFAEGHTRTAMHGLTGAGAGQLALGAMASHAFSKAQAAPPPVPTAAFNGAAQAPATLPPPAPANAAGWEGSVFSAFRDASGELEMLDDDEDRFATDEYIDADGWEADEAA
jgi:hypothetical protein